MTLQGFSSPLHSRTCGEADIGPLVVPAMAFGMAKGNAMRLLNIQIYMPHPVDHRDCLLLLEHFDLEQ
jgi:hypothetical protein